MQPALFPTAYIRAKIKAGHKRLSHNQQMICPLCGKLLRPAIWWLYITSLRSNVPRCSVSTKSFIRRFLGSFNCAYIIANGCSPVNSVRSIFLFFDYSIKKFDTFHSCNFQQPKVTSRKTLGRYYYENIFGNIENAHKSSSTELR